jgi:hypothetical protein
MSEGIIALIGTIVGSLITVVYQSIIDCRMNKNNRRNECIKNINDFPLRLKQVNNIIDKIIDFIDADFLDKSSEEENTEIYNNIIHLYNEKNIYFWDTFVENIYLLLPKNSSKIAFKILENVLRDTKNMSENIKDYLEIENDFIIGLSELQLSFRKIKDNYIVAKYVVYKLMEEYYSNINRNYVFIKMSRKYYSKYKKNIKKAIKDFNNFNESKTAYNIR